MKVKIRHFVSILSTFALTTGLIGAEKNLTPDIRYTAKPAITNGKPVVAVWKNADTLTRFVQPKKFDAASNRTEAKLMFDNKNLYIDLKAYLPAGKTIVNKTGRSLFASDNFEIFIQPDLNKGDYYHIAISADGQIYKAKRKNSNWAPGINAKTTISKGFWRADIIIPLAGLGIAPPAADNDKKIRVNICRNDISGILGAKAQASSYVPLEIWDYHEYETWAIMNMTRKAANKPRIICNRSRNINLLPNPEFDIVKNGKLVDWRLTNKDASRQETMAMSGEWIVRATGKAYYFLRSPRVNLVTDKIYTLKIKARNFGGDGALGVILFIKKFGGGVKEGRYIGWNTPLSSEFHEFNIPFKAVKDSLFFLFYRIGKKENTCGIDIASVRLFEGKISPFEIRKFNMVGYKKAIKGTAPVIPLNFHGPKAKKLKVLAVASRLVRARDYMNIFAGLNVGTDILITTGKRGSKKTADIYYALENSKLIQKRIKDNYYDLYMVGQRAAGRVGKLLAKQIEKNVEAGAGILINTCSKRNSFKALINRYNPQHVNKTHYLKMGFPISFYPLPYIRNTKTLFNPLASLKTVKAKKGRIVLSNTVQNQWTSAFRMSFDADAYSYITFPLRRYADAWLARLVYYAANKVAMQINKISTQGNSCTVNCSRAGDDTKLVWQLDDKNGKLIAKGNDNIKDSKAVVSLPKLMLSGKYVLALWLKDKDGKTLDYCTKTINKSGPEIIACKSSKESYSGNESGVFTVTLKNVKNNMTLVWELEDFSGRILETGKLNAQKTSTFKVPLDNVQTNLARLWIRLKAGKKDIDARRFAVFLKDRDRKRLMNDYASVAWPGGGNPDEYPDFAQQMEKIGIKAYLMPHQGIPVVLNQGLAVGGKYRGGGDAFCALYPPQNHIRRPSQSDPKFLNRLKKRVKKIALRESKYGVIQTAVCDEPNYSRPATTQEIGAHPENIKTYRQSMRRKYGTISKFNKQCATNYKSFDELNIVLTKDARKKKNFSEFVEWRNHTVDKWINAIRLIKDVSKSVDKDTPAVSLYNSFGVMALSGNDYWKLLTKAGLDHSNEYTEMVYLGRKPLYNFGELYRSFRPDMRVWGFIGYYGGKARKDYVPWWFALHRFGGFTWFAEISGSVSGRWLNLLDPVTLELNVDAKQLMDGLKASALTEGMGKVFFEYDWKKRDIAILYSQSSLLVSWCRGKEIRNNDIFKGTPYADYHYTRDCLRYMLENLLYQYDFVAPEQISKGVLDSYKVLILPHVSALSDSRVEIIKDFIKKGGVVIADIMPGKYDELGAPRDESPFKVLRGSNKLVLFNKNFDDKDQRQSKRMFELLRKAGVLPIMTTKKVWKTPGREAMHFVNGNMNVYAISRHPLLSNDKKTQNFTFPTKGHLYDMRAGKYLGETNQVTCAVPNAGTKVYGHYPYKVTGIAVNAPAKVQAGKDLTADISINASNSAVGNHVFHIAVIPPSGKARWFMKRNVGAPAGKYKLNFRMAKNDLKAKWTLLVKDVMSGTTTKKYFNLY